MTTKTIASFAALAAAAAVASADIRITEWLYSGASGEFVELTNVGAAPIDMTGWSYDDDSAIPGSLDLSAFGIVLPGESVVFTEATEASFRAAWSLPASVKVIGEYTNNLGRNDQINIFDNGGVLIDRLTYGDQTFPGTIRTQDVSGWALVSGPGPFGDVNGDWIFSTLGDLQGSYFSSQGELGSPGKYVVPAPGAAAVLGFAALAAGRRRRNG